MKTLSVLKRVFQVVVLATMALTLANCSKDSGSSSSRYQCYDYAGKTVSNSYCTNSSTNYNNSYYGNTYGNTYGSSSYICKDTSTGNQVQASLCANTSTSGYYIQNNMCYYNGAVQNSLQVCYSAGVTTSTSSGGSCVGNYHNGQTWYQCGTVHNCAGATLYNQNNQIVTCY